MLYRRQSVGCVCEYRRQMQRELHVAFRRSLPQPDESAEWFPEVSIENRSKMVVCAQPFENSVRKPGVLQCLNMIPEEL